MKTLLLHLGLPKTASTSIQITLSENAEALARANYVYADIAWPDGKNNANHSFPITVAFSDGWQKAPELVRRGLDPDGLKTHFMAQLDTALNLDENLILSGENIGSIPESGLRAFLDMVARHGRVVHPVIFVRPPLEFLTSMSQTRVRHGAAFEIVKVGISARLRKCLKVWPDALCLPFRRVIAQGSSPLDILIRQFSLGDIQDFKVFKVNESMSEFPTRLVGYINERLPLYVNGSVNPQRRYLDTDRLAAIRGPKFLLTKAEFEDVRSFVLAENEALARMLGPEYCDRDFSFQDHRTPWTAEAFDDLRLAMATLSAPLKACIRAYFLDSGHVSAAERALASDLLPGWAS